MKLLFPAVLALLIFACASKKVEQEVVVDEAAVQDITVPPSMGTSTARPSDDVDPDETVSFRKWRDEQLNEK